MAHIRQKLVNIIHLVAVTKNSAPGCSGKATQSIGGSCDTYLLYVGSLGISVLWVLIMYLLLLLLVMVRARARVSVIRVSSHISVYF